MKIRSGFVSNSSSSSFIAVGISKYEHPKAFKKIMAALNLTEDACYDELEEKEWDSFDYGTYRKHGIYLYENDGVYMVGMNASEDIANDKRLSEIKERLKKQLNKVGVDVDVKDMKLEYGEVGSG